MPVPMQKFREAVFQMLYSYDMGRATDESMLDLLAEELAITKKVVRDVQLRVHQIRSHLKEIDEMITATSRSYNFERIQSVERNILRLGVFELFFDEAIPPKVAMAEALRLARKFATKESGTFVNAILDALYKSSLGEDVDTVQLQLSADELAGMETIAHEAAQTTGLDHLFGYRFVQPRMAGCCGSRRGNSLSYCRGAKRSRRPFAGGRTGDRRGDQGQKNGQRKKTRTCRREDAGA